MNKIFEAYASEEDADEESHYIALEPSLLDTSDVQNTAALDIYALDSIPRIEEPNQESIGEAASEARVTIRKQPRPSFTIKIPKIARTSLTPSSSVSRGKKPVTGQVNENEFESRASKDERTPVQVEIPTSPSHSRSDSAQKKPQKRPRKHSASQGNLPKKVKTNPELAGPSELAVKLAAPVSVAEDTKIPIHLQSPVSSGSHELRNRTMDSLPLEKSEAPPPEKDLTPLAPSVHTPDPDVVAEEQKEPIVVDPPAPPARKRGRPRKHPQYTLAEKRALEKSESGNSNPPVDKKGEVEGLESEPMPLDNIATKVREKGAKSVQEEGVGVVSRSMAKANAFSEKRPRGRRRKVQKLDL